jgi:prepilin-type N-terminal cleavage/methylation domain-containing protein
MLKGQKIMRKGGCTINQAGFTLIELISVIVIIGVMASVGVKKIDLIGGTATDRAMQEAVKELNIRESLTWTNIKLSSAGWADDAQLFAVMDTDLGSDCKWTAGPNALGGTLSFRNKSIVLNRTASTTSSIGSWQ